MIRAKLEGAGREILVLGLEPENMARLMSDEPIRLPREKFVDEMGFTGVPEIWIVGGKDQQAILDTFAAQGISLEGAG